VCDAYFDVIFDKKMQHKWRTGFGNGMQTEKRKEMVVNSIC